MKLELLASVERRVLGIALGVGASVAVALPAYADPVEITYLTQYSGQQLAILEEGTRRFQEANPDIKVTIQLSPYANLLSTLRTRASSPNGPSLIDIYDMWLPEIVRDGIAASAPDAVVSDIKDNYSPGAYAAVTKAGVTYGYPYEISVYGMLYNKRLFEEAGIAAPPTNWDETIAAAKALTKPGQQGVGLITSWQNGTQHPFLSWAASNGVELLKEGSVLETNLTDEKMLEVARLYQRFVEEGVVDTTLNASNAESTGDYLTNFAAGKTGMLVMANWIKGALIASMGEERFAAEVGVAPVPVGPSGTQSAGIAYSWISVVNAKNTPAQQEAAWKLAAFLAGPESGLNGSSAKGDLAMSMGSPPVRNSDVEVYREAIEKDPFIAGFTSLMSTALPYPTVLGGQAVSDNLAQHIEAIIFGQMSADDAMTEAKAVIEGDLAKANN